MWIESRRKDETHSDVLEYAISQVDEEYNKYNSSILKAELTKLKGEYERKIQDIDKEINAIEMGIKDEPFTKKKVITDSQYEKMMNQKLF
jgi:hypothetical protein